MLSTSWLRVTQGLHKVAQAAYRQTWTDVGHVASRTALHGLQMAESLQQRLVDDDRRSTMMMMMMNQSMSTITTKQQQQQQQQHSSIISRTKTTLDQTNQHKNDTKMEDDKRLLERMSQQQHPQQPQASSEQPSSSTVEVDSSSSSSTTTVPPPPSATTTTTSTTTPIATPIATPTATTTPTTTTTNDTPSSSSDAQMVLRSAKDYDASPGTAVPTTRFGRAWGFARLGAGLALGTAAEGLRRVVGNDANATTTSSSSSIVMNDANANRLAASLCRMRGAALKLGQMLSIQDESMLPEPLTRALEQVRQGADAMPRAQLEQQLRDQLGGENWCDRHFAGQFDFQPLAAASIGQVHRATTVDGRAVVVKVQYPGVADSIESDLRNLTMLIQASNLAPRGLYIDKVLRVGQAELKLECDYQREGRHQEQMRQHVQNDAFLRDAGFYVPAVILATDQVLVSEFVPGSTIDHVSQMHQTERNRIGRAVLYLTLREIFLWRMLQTDPNWGNFLYDVGTRRTALIDFGATRTYTADFLDGYLRMVWASANRDATTLLDESRRLHFLTGDESDVMLEAHQQSGYTVGEPFAAENAGGFDFRGSNISARLSSHMAVFMKHRLIAPPEEVYTLHRKIAGAFMLCIKLGARIECRDILRDVVREYEFSDGRPRPAVD